MQRTYPLLPWKASSKNGWGKMPRKRIQQVGNAKTRKLVENLQLNTLYYRDKCSWNQEELSDASGLAIGTVRELEQGKVTNPRIETVVALSDAFGLEDPLVLLRKPKGRVIPK
ncbi:MAG: helix-turn-helix domain-containing protein [Bdellovibrionota bacterium]